MEHNNTSSGANATTARTFFLYLAGAITLIWLVTSALVFTFQLIDMLVPDALDQGYWFSTTQMLTGALASLMIVTPFFLGITTLINRDLKKHPEKQGAWVRKWLLYAILFLSFIVALGDLVILFGSFLNGELTARFMWKALVVLVVSAKVFTYFLYDLRRNPESSQRIPFFSGIALGATVLILSIVGFAVAGTPAEQRDMRLDQERVNDLQMLSSRIESYYSENESLPDSLDDLNGLVGVEDPVSGEPYEYSVTGEQMFELCAEFARESDERQRDWYDDSWEHEAGRDCFGREIIVEDNTAEPWKGVRSVPVE